MKFFESLYGELVNVAEISKVNIESNGISTKYYSYIHLKNDEKIDFIELPETFKINKDGNSVDVKLNEGEYLFMIKRAIEFILENPNPIVHNVGIQTYCMNTLMTLLH